MFNPQRLIVIIFFLIGITASGSNKTISDHTLKPHFIPRDVYYSWQWHLPGIKAPAAWDITRGDPGVIIAVLDSGVDSAHPNLSGGKVMNGYNFVDDTSNTLTDSYGHGTMIAGIAAAPTGTGGVVGVCPDCSIMSVVIADARGICKDSALARGIRYAADRGAGVINISYGSALDNPELRDAVNYAWDRDVVIVASAGNEPGSSLSFPAAYANVIAVSATDRDDNPASFTAHGTWIDVSAPGVDIVTTGLHGKYAAGSGTSFSAAIIAGLAGLVRSANPNLTNDQVADVIRNYSSDPGAAGHGIDYRTARLDLQKALMETIAVTAVNSTVKEDPRTRFNKRALELTRLVNKAR
ncbi:MAG: hypothetical protein C4581_00550 [Nitrospiraceae bacterium]|nr:MAG: hypothetical protein C4581_00550 [Nitrospiraceae bacterium]